MHWRVLLGDIEQLREVTEMDREYVMRRALEHLGQKTEDLSRRQYRARLYLAIHFCPKSALEYDRSSPTPRFELIEEYIVENFGIESRQVEALARGIAKLLETWEKERGVVTSYKDRLLDQQSYTCRHCNINFNETPASAKEEDPYKPYHPSVDERTSPEVDHIEPISVWGTNDMENLQVICRLCNYGKGDGLGIEPKKEVENSGLPIEYISWSHRAKMNFYVIQSGNSTCKRCGAADCELTIRPIREDGGFVQSNLKAVCVECAYN
jgi:5-methylcytosine-specific restriction endonuclease McrA